MRDHANRQEHRRPRSRSSAGSAAIGRPPRGAVVAPVIVRSRCSHSPWRNEAHHCLSSPSTEAQTVRRAKLNVRGTPCSLATEPNGLTKLQEATENSPRWANVGTEQVEPVCRQAQNQRGLCTYASSCPASDLLVHTHCTKKDQESVTSHSPSSLRLLC